MITYHFIGIGGIGMSALASLLLEKKEVVQGSDQNKNDMTSKLQKKGARVFIGHREDHIKKGMVIIYSSAIFKENPEFQRAKKLGLTCFHRSEFLDHLTRGKKRLMITGSHGKTTTTSFMTTILKEANFEPSFSMGGKFIFDESNAGWGRGKYFVLEGDESDGSFLKSEVEGAIVTNLEPDHLDYWKSYENLKKAFAIFSSSVKNSDLFVWCKDDPELSSFISKGVSFGFSKESDFRCVSLNHQNRSIVMDVSYKDFFFKDISISLMGKHNALNALAAFALAYQLKIPEEVIRKALKNYQGIKRRLEFKDSFKGIDLYDDYAHHPTEIHSTLSVLKEVFPHRRIVAVFEPHRHTRVSLFYDDFLSALSLSDEVFVMDIFSASEKVDKKITKELFVSDLRKNNVKAYPFINKSDLSKQLRLHDVVVLLGAGSVTEIGENFFQENTDNIKKIRIGLILGGESNEHEVALSSSRYVVKGLREEVYDVKYFGITKEGDWIFGKNAYERLLLGEKGKPICLDVIQELLSLDVIFPIVHGPRGEDGMFQGFLDTLKIPYIGCDYYASSFCMNKAYVKALALRENILTPSYVHLLKKDWLKNVSFCLEKIENELSFPVWIKGCHLGSSLGVKKIEKKKHLTNGLHWIFSLDDQAIIEEEIKDRQVEYVIIGNDQPEVFRSGEILAQGKFHDYQSKYSKTASTIKCPARLPKEWEEKGQRVALRMYELAGCSGFSRIDFFLDFEGRFWFNEINPIPGLTPTSMFPIVCQQAELSEIDVVDRLIQLALKRKKFDASKT